MKTKEIRKPTPNEFDDVIESCICKLNEKEMFVVLSLIAMNKDYQARIDKTIEYIKSRLSVPQYEIFGLNIIDILEGKDK